MQHPSSPPSNGKWNRLLIGLVVTASFLTVCVVPAAAQSLGGAAPTPSERRADLIPVYERLMADPEFDALLEDLGESRLDDRAALDRYLRFLPLSPLDLLELDMGARRYEHVVPRHVHDWHLRWIELKPELARKHYGDAYVDEALTDAALKVDPQVDDDEGVGAAPRTTAGGNRNVAATEPVAPDQYQGEIQVVVNPNNPDQVVAAANTWDDAGGACGGNTQAIFHSDDGGVTWGYTCAPDDGAYGGLNCPGAVFGSDPALYWADDGEVFLEYMLLCQRNVFDTRFAIVVAGSTDGGENWNGRGVVANSWGVANRIEDKQFLAIDNNAASPFSGRMYTCWDRANDERFAFSTDGGVTWTEVNLPAPPGGGLDLGCEIAVQDNGTVHLIFNTLTCGAGPNSCTNERMLYTRSTNGGNTWTNPTVVHDYNLVGFSGANCPDAQDERCISGFGAIGVDNSGGACDGDLYVTYSDFTTGAVDDTDVWVRRSTNNGATWSAGVRVNDGGVANRTQFHPFLQVDQANGDVVVAWHDARHDFGNDAVDIYLSRSRNCGASFERNTRVTQRSTEFNNSTITASNENTADNANRNPNQYGEYLGLDVLDGQAYVAWTDSRHFFPTNAGNAQRENVGFSKVELRDCVSPPSSLRLWYPFDDTGNTAFNQVSTYNGTYTNGPSMVPGQVVHARDFDGSNDYVRVVDHGSVDFHTYDFSIDAWVRTTDTNGAIVSKRQITGGNYVGYLFMVNGGRLLLQIGDTTNSWRNYTSSAMPRIDDGQWHFVAVTVDRNSTTGGRMYVDGNLVYTFNPTGRQGSISNASELNIGRDTLGGSYLDGEIDEVEIFGKVLSAAEVQGIWNARGAGKCRIPKVSMYCFGTYSGSSQVTCNASGSGGSAPYTYTWNYYGSAWPDWGSSGNSAWANYLSYPYCTSSSFNYFSVSLTDANGQTAYTSSNPVCF